MYLGIDVVRMDGWMDGWVGGWMDGWMGLYYVCVFLVMYYAWVFNWRFEQKTHCDILLLISSTGSYVIINLPTNN